MNSGPTHAHTVEATPPAQWVAATLQVVNWGGFGGHHRVELSDTATLFAGASGSGKSTLLDAYIALMMDANTAFNGASNEHATGRARSATQRSVLSYVRGKYGDTRSPDTGALHDEVLRGHSTPTWSAVAMTWTSSDGQTFTALRLYYAPASASRDSDLVRLLASTEGTFDLSSVEPFAAERFPRKRITDRFPALSFHESYATFSETVCTRLGIGSAGQSRRALALLARIQGGRQVGTVDSLFKTMVLDRPATYSHADQAVAHFDDLAQAYATMKDAEAQVAMLADVPALGAQRDRAAALAEMVDSLDLGSPGPNSAFHRWQLDRHRALLEAEEHAQQNAHARLCDTVAAAADAVSADEGALAEVRAAQAAHGGDAIARLDADIARLEREQQRRAEVRSRFQTQASVLGVQVHSQAQFDRLRTDSIAFLESVTDRLADCEREEEQLIGTRAPLVTQLGTLQAERTSLAGRDSLVPDALHRTRLALAAALDVDPTELPFVAELLDMAPPFESWREAAELALGGFAVTLLVEQDRVGALRRAVNSMRLPRRIRFEAITVVPSADVGVPGHGDHAMLPARFVYSDHRFTAWLQDRLWQRFAFTCVDSAAELDRVSQGLTITGQTRQARRGAHGGHGQPGVIGFSNIARIAELDDECTRLRTTLEDLTGQLATVRARRTQLGADRDVHNRIVDVSWSSIDVASVADELGAACTQRDQLLAASDVLAELAAREATLTAALRVHTSEWARAQNRRDDVGARVEQLRATLESVRSELAAAGDDQPVCSEAQAQFLDARLAADAAEVTVESFPTLLRALAASLVATGEQARKEVATVNRTLAGVFARFQDRWPHNDVGIDPEESFAGFCDILATLQASGLHARRSEFSRRVNEWSGQDLLMLHGAFTQAVDDIEERLIPVNAILAGLDFGPGGDRLHITLRRTSDEVVTRFRRELKFLASDSTVDLDLDAVEKRFIRLSKFIDRIRPSANPGARDHLIDVRRHVYIEAQRRSPDGQVLGVYNSLGDKSGGETQELVAFIVGAALRYQLGDPDVVRPRYAPVLLDEGFIKSDDAFAGRGVLAWLGLGFQLIIGAPNDKVSAIEPYVDRIVEVIKSSSSRRSRTVTILAVDDPDLVTVTHADSGERAAMVAAGR